MAILLCISSTFSNEKWELEKDKNGIKVYTKKQSTSDFKAFKAVAEVKTSRAELIQMFRNVAEYKKWLPDVNVVELKKQDSLDQYHYVETNTPWPVTNRDMVYHYNYRFSTNAQDSIAIIGVPDYVPEKKGIVRIKSVKGYWLLKDKGDGVTEVIYEVHADPNGSLPAMLANAFVVKVPFNTITNIRKLFAK